MRNKKIGQQFFNNCLHPFKTRTTLDDIIQTNIDQFLNKI